MRPDRKLSARPRAVMYRLFAASVLCASAAGLAIGINPIEAGSSAAVRCAPRTCWVPVPRDFWQWDLSGTAAVDTVPCSRSPLVADCPLDKGKEPNFVDFDPLNAPQGNCAAGQAGAS